MWGPLALPICRITNDLIIKVIASGKGCHFGLMGVNIILYSDDILLLASYSTALQSLTSVCKDELFSLDKVINSQIQLYLYRSSGFNWQDYIVNSLPDVETR